MLTRLDRVRPFSLNETMIPAAAPMPAALSRIEAHLINGRRRLRRQVSSYLTWQRGPGRATSAEDQQRRFTVLRMQFNNALSQLDLFAEVITQRSERDNGVWLSGLDVVATDAMFLDLPGVKTPPVVCYLARGPGAAIRRARTRLPGGDLNPVAIVRVPRERMVGHGVASSLVHEVGHQAAALICLVESLRPAIMAEAGEVAPEDREAWSCWGRWVSEIVADLWSVSTLGIGSTLGLLAVVSLPRWAVFRPSGQDPHPIPWVRVLLSCSMGKALYPHPQWDQLARSWMEMYPVDGVTEDHRMTLLRLQRTMPSFVSYLLDHRPAAAGGRTLRELLTKEDRSPYRLLSLLRRWDGPSLKELSRVRPALAFAVIGQGRAGGLIAPEREAALISELLTFWAARTTLDLSAICAEPNTPAVWRAS